jgi:starch synthase (maltosyl-transferring)
VDTALSRADGRARVVIENVTPSVDGGETPVKRVIGDRLLVGADLLVDGHDKLAGIVAYRRGRTGPFREIELSPVEGTPDRWGAGFVVDELGIWQFAVEAWVDAFATWLWGLVRKSDAGVEVSLELMEGAALASAAAERATSGGHRADAENLRALARTLAGPGGKTGGDAILPQAQRVAAATSPASIALMRRWPDRSAARRMDSPFEVVVDPLRAQFSSWYELFPRSTGAGGAHGTFADTESQIARAAAMGFDVVYLPPIHPIGRTHRKGPNNTLEARAGDPGSPWAIGGPEGGHTAVHPQLGTLADFRRLVDRARALGVEIALDIAFQASPDHPWVTQHPDWFVTRPDGSIQHAENPPKKYQDVYPFDFGSTSWSALWQALAGVFGFWIDQGVRVFRVDNPHTKPLPFWRWCLTEIKRQHPDVIFLSEAFTRPKLMYGLAKAGFSQSYTYFTWRTTKRELTEYLTEITQGPVAEFFRPNLWPNTPDILPEHLQVGTRATFVARLVLAATLSASYGIYGAPFELMERTPREGAEEYVDNEKFQLRRWDLDRPDGLGPIIKIINQVRRDNPALQGNRSLAFHDIDNDLLLAYSKVSDDGGNVILVVVNLDGRHRQSGWLTLDLRALGIAADESFQVHDLLSDARFVWAGARAYVELDPEIMPAHVFHLRRRGRTERNFEYYL